MQRGAELLGELSEAEGAVGRLDTRQRTEFRSSITRLGVSPLRDVAFGLAVGTAIPRSVKLHRLPPAIVSIVPFVVAILRYAVDVDGGNGGEPEEIVLGDRVLQVLGLVWVALIGLAVYFAPGMA